MKKLTITDIQKRIGQRFPNEHFTILEFSGMLKPGKIQCNNCGHLFNINQFGNFLAKSKKYGCSFCQSQTRIQHYKNLELLQERYNILDTYVKETHVYYKVSCKKCGHIRESSLKNLIRSIDCGCITNVKRNRNGEEFIKEVNSNSKKGSYILLGDYINQTTPVLLKHDCGFIWKVRPADIIFGRTMCPKCSRKESKGEIFIRSYLESHGIPFEQEKRLEHSKQRFDFYLENQNMKIAIEYNGKQHYEETNFFVGSLSTFQERDNRKKEYCKANGIELYVIPYTLTNEQIIVKLEEILSKFNDYPKGVV